MRTLKVKVMYNPYSHVIDIPSNIVFDAFVMEGLQVFPIRIKQGELANHGVHPAKSGVNFLDYDRNRPDFSWGFQVNEVKIVFVLPSILTTLEKMREQSNSKN